MVRGIGIYLAAVYRWEVLSARLRPPDLSYVPTLATLATLAGLGMASPRTDRRMQIAGFCFLRAHLGR